MKKEINHTTFRNGKLFCINCGGEHTLVYPSPIGDMTKKMESFNKLHAKCKPEWKEPIPDMKSSTRERMDFWLKYGEQGTSSKAIFQRMAGHFEMSYLSHPHDPDDFKRCYKLLEIIPEWKESFHLMKDVSPIWNRLVENWDTLTNMYERNVKEEWKNHKEVGMYELMEQLTR